MSPLLSLTLGVLFTVTCARALPVLTQDPSASVTPGQSITLKCTLTEGKFETYCVYWIQQKAGRAPRFILKYCKKTGITRGEGVPDRFSGSKDNKANEGYLEIVGTLLEDDAEYYCYIGDNTDKAYIFGGGTQLNVLSGETKTPALNVFPPSSEEVATNKATLVCTLSNFYPGSVTVTWKADDQTISSGVETTRPSKQSDNNLFMASSYLSVPAADWSTGKKYTCQATHESKIIEKSVKHSECV